MEKDLKIFKSKTLADGSKYFSLFEKHIPALNDGNNVYLYMLGNLHCICEIIQKNPNAKYFIHDSDEVFSAVQIVMDGYDISKTVDVYDIDMKFDCIIMNPPYDRDLHLKIMKTAMSYIDLNAGGILIALHPSKWIKRFDYWKNKWNMFPVESVDSISGQTATTTFNAGIGSDLIITTISKNGSYDYRKFSRYIPWVKDKIIDNAPCLLGDTRCKFRTFSPDNEFQLNLPIVHGHANCYDMTEITSKSYDRALNVKFGKRPQDINSLCFTSENERRNFYDSLFTTFMKFLIVTCRDGQTAGSCYYAIPVMDDYSQPWTDERFKEFFKLTDEEWKYIEETMAKYVK